MSYRPIKLGKGWTKATLKEAIKAVEAYLYKFTKTRAYDAGTRLSETEAYLQGLIDAKKLQEKK